MTRILIKKDGERKFVICKEEIVSNDTPLYFKEKYEENGPLFSWIPDIEEATVFCLSVASQTLGELVGAHGYSYPEMVIRELARKEE